MSVRQKVLGALFYAASSTLIMLVNKYVLTLWNFPSANFLGLSQFVFTIISLWVLKRAKIISFPDLTIPNALKVFPLPLLFLLNTITGLYGTKVISIPMFAVLRRLSILMTMVLEYLLLGYTFSYKVKLSIFFIIIGSFIAAYHDLAFEPYGYFMVMLNNIFTALNGVISKSKMQSASNSSNHHSSSSSSSPMLPITMQKNSSNEQNIQANLGQWGLMFYNSLFSAPLLYFVMWMMMPDELQSVRDYEYWYNPVFLSLFLCSSIMGAVLQGSLLYCTKVNSSLTTTVVGCMKNVITTYYGMIAPGMDYVYSLENFIGVNLSMAGGIWYAILQLRG